MNIIIMIPTEAEFGFLENNIIDFYLPDDNINPDTDPSDTLYLVDDDGLYLVDDYDNYITVESL